MAEEAEEKASGDTVSIEKEPEVPPPKVPDVELIVDGFGFMPSDSAAQFKSRSYELKKTSKSIDELQSPDSSRSPCASSTNLDIVRRFTWKTKNRMTVQVPNNNLN